MSFSSRFEWRFLSRFVLRSAGFPFSTFAGLRCEKSFEAARAGHWTDGDLASASNSLRDTFAQERDRGRDALLRLAADPALQEAVYLSSPDFFHNNLGKYLSQAAAGQFNANVRRIERRLFNYVQRFVAKNETTSTFGPLNHGSFGTASPSCALSAGPASEPACDIAYADGGLIQRREVFLTFWALRALAASITHDEALADVLPLRLHPMVEVVRGRGLRLHQMGKDLPLSPAVLDIFARIDGTRSQARLCENHPPAESAAFDKVLRTLLAKGCVLRGPFVASSELRLLPRLRADVAALPDTAPARHWAARLDAWQRWCDTMTAAGFDDRRTLVVEAEARFTAETGLAASRGQGEMYADRTIFYEESLGNVQRLHFSADAHAALGRRLRGALELSAAVGHDEWTHLRSVGSALLRKLSPDGTPMPFADFIKAANAEVGEFPAAPVSSLQQRLENAVRRRMAHAAAGGETLHAVDIDAQELQIPEVGEPLYALPDMFISAASEDLLRAGHFDLFLGKLHHHVLLPGWLTTFMPDQAGLRDELRRTFDAQGLGHLVGLEVMRRNKGFYAFAGTRITYAEEPPADVAADRLPMRDLRVSLDERGEPLLSAPGRPRLNLYLTLADHARYLPFALFTLPWLAQVQVKTGEHTPRLLIDGVVIQRERWTLAAKDVLATQRADEFTSFMLLAQWCAARGLPQQVYVKGLERKPVFIDLAIPPCHALLRAMAGKTDTLRVEEMYPAPDGLWLNRARGGFTCEMRASVFKLPVPANE